VNHILCDGSDDEELEVVVATEAVIETQPVGGKVWDCGTVT
jgi:hypothetical protein